MRYYTATDFTASRAWGAQEIAVLDGTSVRLHWTDAPYVWHVNDGQEVFVLLDGELDMHVRTAGGEETVTRMTAGMIAHAPEGTEHVARPDGVCRILVIEREGSL